MGRKRPKIWHIYPTIMKLGTLIPYLPYLKKIQKGIYHMVHPLSSVDLIIFYQKSATFVILGNADKDCILMHNFYLFKLCLSLQRLFQLKLIQFWWYQQNWLGLLKIKIVWNKGYDTIIFVHDVTNKILWCSPIIL